MEHQVSTKTGVRCGACTLHNLAEAKYCAGCGQSLYENCGACGKPVLLTQSFCGACGEDLEKAIQSRHRRHEEWMSDALRLAKQSEYERAIETLGKLVELTDYRFKDLAADAAKAIDKIVIIRDRAVAAVELATHQAIDAFEKGNHREIVGHLESVPANLLSEDARKLLARAQAFASEWSELETSLKSAIAEKNWGLVGKLIQRLLELEPHNSQYQKLAQQVAGKLLAESKKLLDAGQYDAAVDSLDALPEIVVNQEIQQLRELADNIHWLSEQFDCEPFASPMLGRLAVRLAKETPKDSRTQKLVQQLSHQLKQAPRPPRMHLPPWKGAAASWMGGEAGLLGLPTSIGHAGVPEFRAAAGRFNIAIGLAIQGLGKGRITEDFLIKKKGLLSFGKRKNKECWGLDIGTSAIKGVLIEESESGLEVVDVFLCELETPLTRRRADSNDRSVLLPAIEKFLEQKQSGETPIWVNLPANYTVNRFVRLPPVKDKEANSLLTQEIENKIPIPMNELVVARWIHHANREAVLGRPAIACTARRSIVTQRIDLIESCGLKIAGLQCDSIALANFGAFEFASLWSEIDAETEGELDAYEEAISKAVVLVDCGASSTNILLLSGEAHWCWTVEIGGEDLTSQIARATKLTNSEAEKLKRNPAALASPASQYHPVEIRLDELRARLSTVFADGMKQGTSFKSVQSWCMGGAVQAHQWIRRVMLSSGSPR